MDRIFFSSFPDYYQLASVNADQAMVCATTAR